MKKFKDILYNLNIVLAGMFIVFQILDIYNPTMNFIGNNVTVYLFFAFCVLSIVNSCFLLVHNRRTNR
ncbi:MAG: hypothetical protein CVU97_05025 [Firmicutes bacterium HGW-Firmicutes-21]|nr:MAG: hypothetical protein CVU97_05025 [Firmicutes bacterium HGW-Firmicutes-21]